MVCNGIEIRKQDEDYRGWLPEAKWGERFGLKLPNVSVFDPDGRLPLNLQRTGLSEPRYPFDEALFNDVVRDFLAFSLVYGPTSLPSRQDDEAFRYAGSDKQGLDWSDRCGDYYFASEGYGYCDAFILNTMRFESLLVTRLGSGNDARTKLPQFGTFAVIPYVGFGRTRDSDDWLRTMLECGRCIEGRIWEWWNASGSKGWRIGSEQALDLLKRKGSRVIVSDWLWKRATTKPGKLPKNLQRAISVEWTENGWHLLRIGNCPPPVYKFNQFAKTPATDEDRSVVTEVYLDTAKKPEPSPIATTWLEILQSAEIPYDLKLRREKLKHAFDELSLYVRAHEAAKKQQDRKLKRA